MKFEKNDEKNTEETKLLEEGNTETAEECSKPGINHIDQILLERGFTWVSAKILLAIILMLINDGIQLTMFFSMVIPLKKYFLFTEWQLKVLPGALFVGTTVSSFFTGWISKTLGRIPVILSSLFICAVATIVMVVTTNQIAFTLSRLVTGLCLGVETSVGLGILTEYLPLNIRGFVLCTIWCGFTFGHIFQLFAMLKIMPDLDATKVPATLLTSAGLIILTIVIIWLILEDGPRNLILHDRKEEAFQILAKIKKQELSEKEKETIVQQTEAGANKKVKSEFCEIFRGDYCLTTVLITLIRGINGVYYYGIYLVSSLTFQKLQMTTESKDSRQVIIDSMILVLFVMISDVISGIQVEFSWFGRKRTMIIDLIISTVLLVLSTIYTRNFAILLSSSMFFSSVFSVVTNTYCLEVYPTKIRDHASGFLLAMRRVGAILSQIIYLWLFQVNMWFPFYFTISLMITNVILTTFLPYETYNQALDLDYKKQKALEIKKTS